MEYTRTDTKQQSRVIDTSQQSKQTPSIFELLQGNNSRTLQQGPVTQRMLYGDPQNAKELIETQIELQKRGPTVDAPAPSEGLPGVEASVPEDDGVEAEVTPGQIHDRLDNDFDRDNIKRPHNQDYFTTVGFEFEFAQFPNGGEGSILQNVLHTQLARSEQIFAYTGLPFFLETDAGSELELVTPPFVIETVEGTSIPLADDVEKADDLMEEGITKVVGEKGGRSPSKSLSDVKSRFNTCMGLDFTFQADAKFNEIGKITNHNLIGSPSKKLKDRIDVSNEGVILNELDILGERLSITPSCKLDNLSPYAPIGRNGIGTQINIAMDAEAFRQMADLPSPVQTIGLDVSMAIDYIKGQIAGKYSPNLGIEQKKFNFLSREIARHLINTFALPYMEEFINASEGYWSGVFGEVKRIPNLESRVKDLRGVWFKDSIRSLITNEIPYKENEECKGALIDALSDINFEGLPGLGGREFFLKDKMSEAIASLIDFINGGNLAVEESEKPGVCEIDPNNRSDVRPDTYIGLKSEKVAPGLVRKKMYLVESRYFLGKEVIHNLRRMACLHYVKKAKSENNVDSANSAINLVSAIVADAKWSRKLPIQ